MGTPDHLNCLLRNLYAGLERTVRTIHGTTDWFKIGKGIRQALYCHFTYLTFMQSTSCEMPGCMNHKLESRLLGETSMTCDTTIMAESKEELKSLLMKEESQKGERGESKS